ncbi:MAG TPA: phosphoribosylanthranilate isomerase [Candidatus Dormibacteraeota bacterium]|nr:phosphoribosylanthranilate isomerase [Candidatus Dormibacteraeota bacterium]
MTKIKICGNTRPEDIELAIELGVDLLGFIFTRSKRHVGVDDVKAVIAEIPSGVERVGVFIDESPEQIAAVANACRLTAIQVYRPLTEEDRALGLLNLPAFRVQDGEDLTALPLGRGDHPLLDTWAPDRIGGTGRAWAWLQAKAVARQYPVVVSGGLTPENVDGAVHALHPWAVDVCSGVEAGPGRKDHAKLRAFVAAVREADRS